jgi:hypothetical protein
MLGEQRQRCFRDGSAKRNCVLRPDGRLPLSPMHVERVHLTTKQAAEWHGSTIECGKLGFHQGNLKISEAKVIFVLHLFHS